MKSVWHLPAPDGHRAPTPALFGSPGLSASQTPSGHIGFSAEIPFLDLPSWQELRQEVLVSK